MATAQRKKKIAKVAKKVTARQSSRHGKDVSKKEARSKAKQIIADRAPARRRATKAAASRHPGDPLSGSQARARGRSLVKARKKTGSTSRTRAVTKSAKAVAGRHSDLSRSEARARARAIVKKRKHK